MHPRFSHLFWDFDGTLYDSYKNITRAALYALSDMGHFAPPFEVYALLKKSLRHACLALAERFSISPDALQDAFYRHHNTAEDFPLFEGVEHCLHTLKKLGCQHYLYTDRDRKAVRQLEKDDLDSFFTGFVTREDGFPFKPAPDALNAMMARYGIPRWSAVFIGDRDVDILAGHNAGIPGILFDPLGFSPDTQVEYRVKSMREVEGLVKG